MNDELKLAAEEIALSFTVNKTKIIVKWAYWKRNGNR
jgi:hypothetical protein